MYFSLYDNEINLPTYLYKLQKTYRVNITKVARKYCKKRLVKNIKLSEGEKEKKKRQYWRERYKNLFENEKQKLLKLEKVLYNMEK